MPQRIHSSQPAPQSPQVWQAEFQAGPPPAQLFGRWAPEGGETLNSSSVLTSTRSTNASQSGRSYNLPARFGYARDQPLRSQFAKSQPRHLEATNERPPASADFAAVHDARGTRVTLQLRQA